MKTESEYANFWNSVSDATEYLDPKRFKSISPRVFIKPVPSIETP